MEIIDECSALLSNREVLEILQETLEAKSGNRFKDQTNLATILYETISYLDSTPASSQTKTGISELLKIFKDNKYDLTTLEKIQIVNHRPSSLVDLHAIIEVSEERFSQEQMCHMVECIQSKLHNPN